jgi:hypothetical protein
MIAPIQQAFEGFAAIADQMPPVEDLLGLWRSLGRTAHILRRAVTAEDANARMHPKPGRELVGCAVGSQIDRPMARRVHEEGTIGAPTTHGPIVHPKDGRCGHGRIRQLADEAQQGVGAGGYLELTT